MTTDIITVVVEKPALSIVIPAYEYGGVGSQLLEWSFDKMINQTFKNFEVIISDHSLDNKIEEVCSQWLDKLNIKYIRNSEMRGNPAANTNNAMLHANGHIIKILCQDDYLYNSVSLENIVSSFVENVNWLATSYVHTRDREHLYYVHFPSWNDNIIQMNTLGTPSCIAIRKFKNELSLFDTDFKYVYDCEWYLRVFKKYGIPNLTEHLTVVNYVWIKRITSKMTPEAYSWI